MNIENPTNNVVNPTFFFFKQGDGGDGERRGGADRGDHLHLQVCPAGGPHQEQSLGDFYFNLIYLIYNVWLFYLLSLAWLLRGFIAGQGSCVRGDPNALATFTNSNPLITENSLRLCF